MADEYSKFRELLELWKDYVSVPVDREELVRLLDRHEGLEQELDHLETEVEAAKMRRCGMELKECLVERDKLRKQLDKRERLLGQQVADLSQKLEDLQGTAGAVWREGWYARYKGIDITANPYLWEEGD